MPKITVIMAAYNAESFLREAVESVLNQTFNDFEFLIFEDCSTDSTRQILESYQDSRIQLYFNETNQGLTKNLVRGMELAKGEYVARMDADDISEPTRFIKQLDYFASHPEVSVLGSAVTFFDNKGYEFIGYQPTTHEEIKVKLFLGFTMLHPSVMMRKADMDKYGLNYDPDFICSQDHDLWTRSIRKLRFANHPEPLLRMREHAAKIGKTRKSTQEELSARVRRWQLQELGVEHTNEEFEAFDLLAGYGRIIGKAGFLACESILLKIVKANCVSGIYEQQILERAIVDAFHGFSRQLLMQKSILGAYFWRSELRRLRPMSLRQNVVMLLRTTNCGIFWFAQKCIRQVEKKKKYIQSFSLQEWFQGLVSFLRFRCYQPTGRSVLMVEPNSFHGEILPGYIHYFNQLGFEVVLLWRKANAESGVFRRLSGAELPTMFTVSPFWLRCSLASVPRGRYQQLLLTSSYLVIPGGYYGLFINYLTHHSILHRQTYLMVEHSLPNLEDYFNKGDFQPKHVFLLSDLDIPEESISMLNPHYFGRFPPHRLCRKRIFVTVGAVTSRNRNFGMLIEAVASLEAKGIEDFEIHVVGRGAKKGLFANASNKIKAYGYMSYDEMYDVVASADFFIPLLDPESEGHRRYLSAETSGSRQLILGFLKPPVIHAEFAKRFGFSRNSAVLYDREGLARGIEQALTLDEACYDAMISKIQNLATTVSVKSLLNLKNAISLDCSKIGAVSFF